MKARAVLSVFALLTITWALPNAAHSAYTRRDIIMHNGVPRLRLSSEWEERIETGIREHRMSDAVVQVLDDLGRPLEGAEVRVWHIRHSFLFGCAFPTWEPFRRRISADDWSRFQEHFLRLFNYSTTENMLKWPSTEPAEGQPNYSSTDQWVRWCRSHGIEMKGHNLVWGGERFIPRWLAAYSGEELQRRVRNRIVRDVTRYKGQIRYWDVINEPRANRWFERRIGPDWAANVMRWAREADPKAVLLVNDYSQFLGDTASWNIEWLKDLKARGGPLDAYGEQAHDHPHWYSPDEIWTNLNRLAAVAPAVHLTEVTYCSNGDEITGGFVQGRWTEEMQGAFYDYLFRIAFAHPKVQAITLWAMWDGSSWLDRGGIIRTDWTLKPAYLVLDNLINREWRTNLSGRTNTAGRFTFRGFHGAYSVEVTAPSGRAVSLRRTLVPGKPNRWVVRLR